MVGRLLGRRLCCGWIVLLGACSSSTGTGDGPALDLRAPDLHVDAGRDARFDAPTTSPDLRTDGPREGGSDALLHDLGTDAYLGDTGPRTHFIAVTFNTGTSKDLPHDAPPADGYTSAQAQLSDQYYGNGLAWKQVVADATAFFAQVQADIVVFQEIFYSGDCATIPASAQTGFVCESWQPGDPTVAQLLVGTGWQVACHPGKPDKCAAVRKSFGAIRGCAQDFCLQGLDGFTVSGCGGGARIGRGVIDLVGGGSITLVNVHGSSGVSGSDQKCREEQFKQVFVDLGDGQPGANGAVNLVLGDLNTDPGRAALFDDSAKKWNDLVAQRGFHFISDVGLFATPTYAGIFNIDHAVSDSLVGSCWSAGAAGTPPVTNTVYFDHMPLVCKIALPSGP